MELTLQRLETGDEGTFGNIFVGNSKFYSLELPWRENERDLSCIDPGKYICQWVARADGSGFCYQIFDVPDRSGILIHAGNFGGDVTKGFRSDLKGCIAIGLQFGALTVGPGKQQRGILNSRTGLSQFEKELSYHSFTLNVSDIPVLMGGKTK